MKRRGIDTPLKPVIDYSTGIFNRANLIPTSPIFSMFNSQQSKKNDEIQLGNFMVENGGKRKYNTDHEIRINATDVIKEFNKDNNNKLNRSAIDGVNEFMASLSSTVVKTQDARSIESIVDNQNEDVLRVEQGILDAIRNANPDL
jgi:hypothetical protein